MINVIHIAAQKHKISSPPDKVSAATGSLCGTMINVKFHPRTNHDDSEWG